MKRYTDLFIAIAGGLLLWAAWPVSPLTFLVFVAFIPLLWLEAKVSSRKRFFGLTYITMFIWNLATTWWIWNASVPGGIGAFLANSFIMCLPWLGFKIVKKWLGEKTGYIALVAFWMCFEYFHLHDWGLSWPWLTLGNAFAAHPEWIQWYEYTGSSGGTLWILLVNIFMFHHYKYSREESRTHKNLLIASAILFIPIGASLLINNMRGRHKGSPETKNIVVVQPNIDPYVKVSDAAGSFESQLGILVSSSEKMIDDNTALVVWPETALYMSSRIDEEHMKENYFLAPFWGFLKRHPNISLFTGIESYRQFDHKTKYSQEFNGEHYESYNGSILIDSSGVSAFYHKSMLVPGVETLPWFLKFIGKWFEKFGGSSNGYARQKERTVLEEKHGYKIAPAICYESVYGEYMAKYVKNGANLICIITNDGWWKKTPGHRQHMNYARLRAIETRTWVVRSANTGISCFIDPNGAVIDAQPYDTNAAIKLNIPVTVNNKTFFVRYGDLLSRVMVGLSVLLFGWTIFLKIRKRYSKKE